MRRAGLVTLPACLAFALLSGTAGAAPVHRCADEAYAEAGRLLKFATDAEDLPHAGMVAPGIKLVRPVKDPVYGGMLDVLEMYGNNYKTTYRIRLLYVRIPAPSNCLLRGQEILQVSP